MYQYNEIEPRGINRKSYEPEIERWLKGEYSDNVDCAEDRIPSEHLSMIDEDQAVTAPLPVCFGDGELWDEEIGCMGLSDDDLDYLTVIDAPASDLTEEELLEAELLDLSVLC